MKIQSTLRHLLAAGLLLTASGAQGALTDPSVWATGWTRTATDTTYAHWNIFSAPAGPNAPDVPTPFNPNGIANLADLGGASFITGGGNIYSFAASLQIDFDVPNYDALPGFTTVVLQGRTFGTEADYTSLLLNGLPALYVGETDRINMGPPGIGGGDQVDFWALFHLPSTSDLTLTFQSPSSSMSLDRVVVDSIRLPNGYADVTLQGSSLIVPAPVSMLPAALALLAPLGRANRRRAAKENKLS